MTVIDVQQKLSSPAPTRGKHLLGRVIRRPLGATSAICLIVVAIAAIIGPYLAPHNPNTASLELVLAPPSSAHPLGADGSGYDILSRMLFGTQVSVTAALFALIVSLVIGVTAGLIAGYGGGWFDTGASWLTSLTMALPGIVVLIAASSAFGSALWTTMLIFGILLSPVFYRLVYAAVRAVRNELYIDAARVSGLSDARIIARHIFPVVRAPIIIQSANVLGVAIAVQAALGFLGLGDSNTITWGGVLADAFANIYADPLLLVWPSLTIGLTCIALSLFANALRDELEGGTRIRRRRTKSEPTPLPKSTVPAGETFDNGLTQPFLTPDDTLTTQSTSLLQVRDLCIGYDQRDGTTLNVVHRVSLDLKSGEVHGLVGESGSGKTQTAFAVLGLLPQGGRVLGGTIIYEGVPLHCASERDFATLRGSRIGYIPQDPMSNLDQSFKIGSQLVEPLRVVHGLNKNDATEKALALLERVGIKEPRRTFDAYPFEISGGMAQRVLIAGAVSLEPDLIIADEPTTALDVSVQAEVLDLLRDLQQENGMAMVLVTHNFGVVADLCDSVTVMNKGVSVESGPVRKILEHPAHPYTQSLLSAVLEGGPARSERDARARS